MRHLTNLIATAFMGLMIAGCTGECEDPEAASCTAETDVDTDTDTDTDSDTDADVDMGTYGHTSYIGNTVEHCQVTVDGTETASFNTAETESIQLKAGEYTNNVGIGNACGGVGCHESSDGKTRVEPSQAFSIVKDGEQLTRGQMGIYLDNEYECTRSRFAYNASAIDFKGAAASSTTDPKQRIQVIDGYKLKPYDSADMHGPVGTGGNYLEVLNSASKGDYINIVEVGDQDDRQLIASSFGADFFEVTIVEAPIQVTDLRCEVK